MKAPCVATKLIKV